jgi:elongation factor G
MRVVVNDGKSHTVDSSDNAFQAAGRGAFREVYPRARPIILEPVMKLEVESPQEFQGAVLKTIMQWSRRCRWRRCSDTPPIFAP